MQYENIWEDCGVYRRFFGTITGRCMIEAVEKVEGDSRFESILYVINDYLEVTDFAISETELKMIAAIDSVASTYNKQIKIAQVTTRQDIIDLVTSYDKKLAKNSYKTGVFSNLEDARKWVDNPNS